MNDGRAERLLIVDDDESSRRTLGMVLRRSGYEPLVASTGADASTIDPAAHGIGWLLHDGDNPTRLLGYHLSDAQISQIAEHAHQLRQAAGTLTGGSR